MGEIVDGGQQGKHPDHQDDAIGKKRKGVRRDVIGESRGREDCSALIKERAVHEKGTKMNRS